MNFAISTYLIAGVMVGVEMQKKDGDRVLVIDLFILRIMVFIDGVESEQSDCAED